MIGHFINSLNPAEETRVLTEKMAPISGFRDYEPECLVEVATGEICATGSRHRDAMTRVGIFYDDAVRRFGASRVNGAIRSRIWSNRARRILQNAPVSRDTEVATQSVGACRFGRGESKEIAND